MHWYKKFLSLVVVLNPIVHSGNGVSRKVDTVRYPIKPSAPIQKRRYDGSHGKADKRFPDNTVSSRTFVSKELPARDSPEMDERFCVNDLHMALKIGLIQSSRGIIRIDRELYPATLGTIYKGALHAGAIEDVAVKFQTKKMGSLNPKISMPHSYGSLNHEYRVMLRMQIHDGFPRVYAPNYAGQYPYYVMDYMGEDTLESLHRRSPRSRLPRVFVLEVAGQMLERILAVHKEGFVAYDFDLSSFILGPNNKVYMTDLPLAYPFRNSDKIHINPGDAPYMNMRNVATRRQVEGKMSSRMDDIERFLYMVVLLLKGKLPWEAGADIRQARNMKLKFVPNDFGLASLTPIFEKIFQQPFNADPPYVEIAEALEKMKTIKKEMRKHSRE